MVSPKALAWEAELKLAAPVAPPRDRVTILPLAWHALIDEARNWQFGSSVPGKFESSEGLQVYLFDDVCKCQFARAGSPTVNV